MTICVHLDHSCSKVPHGSLELTGFFELFLFFFFNFEQNANASASKKASSSAGRSKLQPPAVDGVSVASLDDNSMDDSEVRPSLNRVNI